MIAQPSNFCYFALATGQGKIFIAGLLHHYKKEHQQAMECLEQAYGLFVTDREFLRAIQCLVELAWIKYIQEGANQERFGQERFGQERSEGLSKANLLFSEAGKMISGMLVSRLCLRAKGSGLSENHQLESGLKTHFHFISRKTYLSAT